MLQAREGKWTNTLASVPATAVTAHAAETTGDPSLLFEVLRKRCRERISDRPLQMGQAEALLTAHEEWVKKTLSQGREDRKTGK